MASVSASISQNMSWSCTGEELRPRALAARSVRPSPSRCRSGNSSMSNNLVLLVDDDPELSLMLSTTLELENRRVIVAGNGKDALTLALERHPAVIVLDLMMPAMSGEEFRSKQMAHADIKN